MTTPPCWKEESRHIICYYWNYWMDGGWWCEGGLRPQRNDGGGCATMRERSKRVESPGTFVTEWVSRWFFRTAIPCSGGYHMERGGMPLHDAVGINCKKGATTKIKAQVWSIRAKGCTLMTVCVLSDLTWLPLLGGGRKSWYIIIIINNTEMLRGLCWVKKLFFQ